MFLGWLKRRGALRLEARLINGVKAFMFKNLLLIDLFYTLLDCLTYVKL